MTLILIFLFGGTIAVLVWILIPKGDHLPDGNSMNKLDATVSSKLNPDLLDSKYPLGYTIFGIDSVQNVHHYDNRIVDRYNIDWSVVGYSNVENMITLRLPNISLKDGSWSISKAIVSGPKKVGDMSGATLGDLIVWGEILDIKPEGTVFLIGLQKNPPTLDANAKKIAEAAIVRFHDLFNQDKLDDIWIEADLTFQSTTGKYEFLDMIKKIKAQSGNFISTRNTGFSYSIASDASVLTFVQASDFDKIKAEEKIKIKVKGESATLMGYGFGAYPN